MDIKKLVREYLKSARIMQLATSQDNKPWVCNIHFFCDELCNFYWISTAQRRHSKEIEKNNRAAVSVLIHEDMQSEKYVIGISAEGTVGLVDERGVKSIGHMYIQKLNKDLSLLSDILEGRNPHVLYKFTPSKIVLFDTKNFPDNPRQEIVL